MEVKLWKNIDYTLVLEKAMDENNCTKTDTGEQVEHTKVKRERY